MKNATEPKKRTWTDKEGFEHEASVVYVDASGNEWYAFDRPLQMPAMRAIAAENAAEWALMNFTPEDLLAYLDKMEEDGNKGMIVDIFAAIRIMKDRTKWVMERKSYLELAKTYFVLNDHPLQFQTEESDASMEAIWKKDPECQAFFLRQAFVLTKGFSAFSETDIPAYLRAQDYIHMRTPAESSKGQEPKGGTSSRAKFFTRKGKT